LRWLPPLSVAASAVASGAILALSFPPVAARPLCFVALVPLVVTLFRKPRPRSDFFKAGYLFGVVFFLGILWWIVKLSPSASITVPWLMMPALVVLVIYLSLYPALVFWLSGVLVRRAGVAVVLVVPSLWALSEMTRSATELGFPWGAIAYALAREPLLIQSAKIIGLFGLGALVVLVNVTLAQAWLARSWRSRAAYLAAAVFVLVAMAAHGKTEIGDFTRADAGEGIPIAIAQPNVDLKIKWEPSFTDSTFRLIDRLCRQAAESRAKITIFPETSAPVYLRYQPNYMHRLTRLAAELDMAIYIGFLDGRYEGRGDSLLVFNSAGLFDANDVFVQYDKTHLLPFGEAIPFAWKFPSFKKLDFGQANFHPGPSRPPARSRVGDIGPMICFESIFPGIARQSTRDGADLLVNITNDGWFGLTPGPYQHFEMAIVRAVENHRYLVRSANEGISAVVDPVGRVAAPLALYKEGVVIETIRPLTRVTIYTRVGDRPVLTAALLLTLIGWVAGRSSRADGARREFSARKFLL
jgi:apolipoprotein N-acyltransferase